MAESYIVQKGDTRSAIAKKLGVGVDQVGLGKSGNPDLIYGGETLTIGAPKTAEKTYSSEMSSQLNGMTETPKKSVAEQVYGSTPDKANDPYSIGSLRTEIDSYKAEMDKAYNNLKTIKSDTYNSEYSTRGMDEKKQKIASLDTEIATAKSERDAAISKLKQNPGLSAAQLTGQSKKIADFQNDKINNLIEQRNGSATEYNSELSEIDKVVGNKASDAESSYNYYSGLIGNTQNKLQNYQTALTSELKSDQSQANWEKELAQALTIAMQKGGTSKNLKLVTDPYSGNPKYWYDSSTGEIIPLSGNEGSDETTDEGADTGNIFTSKTQAPAQNQQSTGWWQSIVNGVKGMFGG